MNKIVDLIVAKVENAASRSSRFMLLANTLLDKIAPNDSAMAVTNCKGFIRYYCYITACGTSGQAKVRQTRTCCTTNGVTTCSPWGSDTAVGCC